MGNMLVNKRLEDNIGAPLTEKEEHRLFPAHVYNGPLKLGDPNFRGLTKMEADPMIPQRMRDEARTTMCKDKQIAMMECGKEAGFGMPFKCRQERDDIVDCIQKWLANPDFKEGMTREYLNERSHYRETGIKTVRYSRGHWHEREKEDGPALDENGKYRPRKPRNFDESYKDRDLPEWAKGEYDN